MLVRDRIPLRQDLSETTLAYMAGVIEGDGSIFLQADRTGTSLVVTISNGNLRLLDWVRTIIGGDIRFGATPQRMVSNPLYIWRIQGAEAVQLCSLVLPYLVGKRRQAELVIEAGRVRQGRRRGQRHSALDRRRLREIAEECSWCNKRAWRGENSPYTKSTKVPEQAKLELVS